MWKGAKRNGGSQNARIKVFALLTVIGLSATYQPPGPNAPILDIPDFGDAFDNLQAMVDRTIVVPTAVSSQAASEEATFSAQTCTYDAVIPGVCGHGANWGDLTGLTWGFCEVDAATEAAFSSCIETDWSGSYNCQIVYFSTSGTISIGDAVYDVPTDCLYIAGQTAPSPGIWIDGNRMKFFCGTHSGCNRVAITHVGFFGDPVPSNPDIADALTIRTDSGTNTNWLVMNVSAFWGVDSNIGVSNDNDGITIYQSIMAEPLRDAGHGDGTEHNFNLLIGSDISDEGTIRIDVQRSIFGHARARSPLSSAGAFAFYNNLVYNWNNQGTQLRSDYASVSNIENSLYVEGPNDNGSDPIDTNRLDGSALVYIGGNCAIGHPDSTKADLVDGTTGEASRQSSAHPTGVVLESLGSCTTADEEAFADLLLPCAGPRPSERSGSAGTEIVDFLNTVQAGIDDTSGKGGYLTPSDVSTPSVTQNTVDHTGTAYPIPTGNPNGTSGVYVNNAVDWAAYWHEQVTPSSCNNYRP